MDTFEWNLFNPKSFLHYGLFRGAMHFVRKMGQRGIVTLPLEVRECMGVEGGDLLEIRIVRILRTGAPVPEPPNEELDAGVRRMQRFFPASLRDNGRFVGPGHDRALVMAEKSEKP